MAKTLGAHNNSKIKGRAHNFVLKTVIKAITVKMLLRKGAAKVGR